MDNSCPITGRPLRPGQYVHESAFGRLTPYLVDLPELMDCLTDAIGKRLNKTHTPNTSHNTPPGIPINPTAAEDAWVARTTILIWVDAAADRLGDYTPDNWKEIADFLLTAANELTYWPKAPQAADELGYALGLITRTIDRPPPLTFLGLCPQCATPTYTRSSGPIPPETTCHTCTHTYQTQTNRQHMLATIRNRWLPAYEALAAVHLLTDQKITRNHLDQLTHRNQITTTQEQGHNLYQPHQIINATRQPPA